MTFLLVFTFYSQIYAFNTDKVFALDNSKASIARENTWKIHGVVFDQFQSVDAFANDKNGKFQCTELVHRFLKVTYGVPTKIGLGLGHANTVIEGIYQRFGKSIFHKDEQKLKMTFLKNGTATQPPTVGSPINFVSGKYGHVAIVRYIEKINDSNLRAYIFEQHGFPRWKAGESKPIRSVLFKKNKDNGWAAEKKQNIGTAHSWINFIQVTN